MSGPSWQPFSVHWHCVQPFSLLLASAYSFLGIVLSDVPEPWFNLHTEGRVVMVQSKSNLNCGINTLLGARSCSLSGENKVSKCGKIKPE